MQKFRLELVFQIIGIGSASGFFFQDNILYLISDNIRILYEYRLTDMSLNRHPLMPSGKMGYLENITKKDKPDFEAIAVKDSVAYLFGSGSSQMRDSIQPFDIKNKKHLPPIDATDLYLNMADFAGIKPEDFNIEAAVNDGDTWYLFQRGNGPAQHNAVFTLTGDIKETSFQIIHNKYKLPKIKGVRASFTDAVKVGNKLYFIAAAEKGGSTYEDGAVAGSLIGRIDMETMKIDFTKIISEKNKFEGMALFSEKNGQLEFLLCEDTDSDAKASDIYKLTVDQ